MGQHRRAIDRGDEDRRPALAYGERDRTADQAEADYSESAKWRFVRGHSSTPNYQLPNPNHFQLPIPNLEVGNWAWLGVGSW